jgi:hypothetical protein
MHLENFWGACFAAGGAEKRIVATHFGVPEWNSRFDAALTTV